MVMYRRIGLLGKCYSNRRQNASCKTLLRSSYSVRGRTGWWQRRHCAQSDVMARIHEYRGRIRAQCCRYVDAVARRTCAGALPPEGW